MEPPSPCRRRFRCRRAASACHDVVLSSLLLPPSHRQRPSRRTIRPEQPGLAIKPEESGLTIRPEQQALTIRPKQPGLTIRSEESDLTIRPEQPGLTIRPEQPGLTIRSKESDLTIRPEQPGLTIRPNIFLVMRSYNILLTCCESIYLAWLPCTYGLIFDGIKFHFVTQKSRTFINLMQNSQFV